MVQVTRLLWSSDAGRGLPVRSSPALDRSHLYVGTDGAAVVALDRRTGVSLWSAPMNGPVSSSPALGQLVYAASDGLTAVSLADMMVRAGVVPSTVTSAFVSSMYQSQKSSQKKW